MKTIYYVMRFVWIPLIAIDISLYSFVLVFTWCSLYCHKKSNNAYILCFIGSLYFSGIQIQCNHSKQQMKNQIASENRQAHMLFGVVTLFFIGCTLRMVLNIEEIHQTLTKDPDCGYVVRFWIHVSWLLGGE